jgi:xylulokinase
VGVVLGIDIGTHRSKAVACTADGRVVARAETAHGIATPAPGHVEHDADAVWWADLVTLSRRLAPELATHGGVEAVGVTTCGPCLVPVDGAGRPLRPGILYGIDGRAAPQIAALEARHGQPALERLSWLPLSSQSVGPKIAWIAEREPDIHRQTAAYHTATSYLVLRLTGEAAIDRHQGSYVAPFIDARRRAWDLRFADGLDLDGRLPPLRWPDEVIGGITAEAAAETGLPTGTPVIAGSSDGLAEAIAAGADQPGVIAATYGSTATLFAFASVPGRTRGVWRTDGPDATRTMVGGGLSASGAVLDWFLRELAPDLPQVDRAQVTASLRALGDAAAAVPPGSRGLLMLPYLHGERAPFSDAAARGVIVGLGAAHTRADLYRATLESIAYAVRHLAEALAAAGVPMRVLRATGGMAADPTWLRIVADVTGQDHEVLDQPDGAPVGIARLAARAVGLSGADDDRGWIAIREIVHPDPAAHAAYGPRYALARRLHRDTRDIVHALVAAEETDR